MRPTAVALVVAIAFAVGAVTSQSGSSSHKPLPATSTTSQASTLSDAAAVGQLIVATYAGPKPPASLLAAVRAGKVGSVIMMGDDTDDSVSVTHAATVTLQKAARAGGNPGLLVMTDQEGGEVKRLPGPPDYAAADMSKPSLAATQGYETGKLLKSAGVNVDLAPVADVTRVDGFMTKEQRTFGSNPKRVAAAACAFAGGLQRAGVAYTLKHFPGLGDAVSSTDVRPVTIRESATDIHADDAAYRKCGASDWAMVMVSSAIYSHVTGKLPAVMSPAVYGKLMPADKIKAVTISDSLQTGAIKPWSTPARRAVAAGDDMVMYANREPAALTAYTSLLADVRNGTLSRTRVTAAAQAVLKLKQTLKLTSGS